MHDIGTWYMIVNLVLPVLGLLIIRDKGSLTPDYICYVLYMHFMWFEFDSQKWLCSIRFR